MLDQQFWSDSLAWALLCSLPEGAFANQWGTTVDKADENVGNFLDQLRRELLNWARNDDEIRRWIVRTWRDAHSEVVAAADQAVIERITGKAGRLSESLYRHHILLAFLTDEFDDGRALARAFISGVDDDIRRRALNADLGHLVGHMGETPRRRIRLVILGGHPRDESRLSERVFESSPFEVRWRIFEKKTGCGLVQKGVVSILHDADALLIITGKTNHILAQFAKHYAERHEIIWRCVERATDIRLKAALHEMFPTLTPDWTP